jgi:hypothetical protein
MPMAAIVLCITHLVDVNVFFGIVIFENITGFVIIICGFSSNGTASLRSV